MLQSCGRLSVLHFESSKEGASAPDGLSLIKRQLSSNEEVRGLFSLLFCKLLAFMLVTCINIISNTKIIFVCIKNELVWIIYNVVHINITFSQFDLASNQCNSN